MKHESYYCNYCGETLKPPFEDDKGNISRTICPVCGMDYKENPDDMRHVWASSPFNKKSLMETIEDHKNEIRKCYLNLVRRRPE